MTFAALPTLRTPRLTLRPLKETDTDAIVEGVGNFDVSKWLSVVPYPYLAADADDFIRRQLEGDALVWAICQEEKLIGTVGLQRELGYWLARKAWRKGYGFEAAHAAVSWWFENPEKMTLTSGFFEGNVRSGAVLKSLGFKQTGIEKRDALALAQEVDCHQLELSRADWEESLEFEVRTERLRLRPLFQDDDAFVADLARPEVTRMLFSLPTGIDLDDAGNFIARRTWHGLPNFAAAVEQDGEIVGFVAVAQGHAIELYYALHPDHWGQGLMSEAAQGFLAEIFRRFPINKIVADRFEDNPASGALLEKLGFVETGRVMGTSRGRVEPAPCITYALTRDQLRASL